MHSLAMSQLVAMFDETSHKAPEAPFTIEQARTVMQFHIAYRAIRCPRKAAAFQVLAEAGRLVPSTTHPQ